MCDRQGSCAQRIRADQLRRSTGSTDSQDQVGSLEGNSPPRSPEWNKIKGSLSADSALMHSMKSAAMEIPENGKTKRSVHFAFPGSLTPQQTDVLPLDPHCPTCGKDKTVGPCDCIKEKRERVKQANEQWNETILEHTLRTLEIADRGSEEYREARAELIEIKKANESKMCSPTIAAKKVTPE